MAPTKQDIHQDIKKCLLLLSLLTLLLTSFAESSSAHGDEVSIVDFRLVTPLLLKILTNVSKEHIASIFTALPRNVGNYL
jgi:hypothetical protein